MIRNLAFILIATFAVQEPLLSQDSKMSIRDLSERLGNRSMAPKLPEEAVEKIRASTLGVDVTEQKRVVEVILQIDAAWNENGWESLIERSDDDRYCVTTINDNGYARNWTVGEVCSHLAKSQLVDCIADILGSVSVPASREHIGYHIDFLQGESLREWRAERKVKGFSELQTELAAIAIEIVETDANVSLIERELTVKNLAKLRRRLERTVQSQFVRVSFIGEEYRVPR